MVNHTCIPIVGDDFVLVRKICGKCSLPPCGICSINGSAVDLMVETVEDGNAGSGTEPGYTTYKRVKGVCVWCVWA